MPPLKKGYHRHHLKPRHLGGTDADGIVYMTQEEHADAHYQRWLKYGSRGDLLAVNHIMQLKVLDVSGPDHPAYGYKHTEETKKQISESMKKYVAENGPWNKGKKLSAEHREKIRNNFTGRRHSEETKKKMRAARLKQVITEETKEKIREKLRGHTPWIKGKKHTAEAKRKISEASLRMWAERKAK